MNLRERLRAELRPEHDRLDEAVSRYDLTTRAGFAAFLTLQGRSMSMIDCEPLSDATRTAIETHVRHASADLASLDADVGLPDAGHTVSVTPLAVDYIVGGSQLGNSVLKGQWDSGSDPLVLSASKFFEGVSDRTVWRSFLASAEKVPARGDYADEVTADARKLFEAFLGNAA